MTITLDDGGDDDTTVAWILSGEKSKKSYEKLKWKYKS